VLAVRALPFGAFATYAIALSVQTSLTILSDIGVTTLVLARAGQVHGDPRRLSLLGETARRFRLKLCIPAMLVGVPLLYWSLASARPSAGAFLVILGLLYGTLVLQLGSSIDGALLLSLLQSHTQLFGQLLGSAVRLLCIAVLLAVFPTYEVALAINLVAAAVQALFQRRAVRRLLPTTAAVDEADLMALRTFVWKQFPNAIYFAFSGQIALWLVSVLGSSAVVANVGALGRLTGLIVLLQSGVVTLAAPRFARISDARLLLRRYLQVTGVALGVVIVGMVAVVLFPGPLIWVLGPQYRFLGPLLPISMAAAATNLLATTLFGLNTAKAWVMAPIASIPLTLAVQALGLTVLRVGETRDALLFGWLSAFPPLLMGAYLGWSHLRRLLSSSPLLASGETR
jgi:hypothetical protein